MNGNPLGRLLNRLLFGIEAAFWGVSANKLRSAITILGVAIGVAAVVSLVAIGEGARLSIVRQFESLGTNLIKIESHHSSIRLTVADAEELTERVPSIDAAMPVVKADAQVKWRRDVTEAEIMGVTEEFPYIREHEVYSGRFFSHLHVEERIRVAVLGYKVATDIFGDRDPVGQRIYIGGEGFTVIGVMQPKGLGMADDVDSKILIPVTSAQRLTKSYRVNEIWVKANDRNSVDLAVVHISRIYRNKFNIGENIIPTESDMYRYDYYGYYETGNVSMKSSTHSDNLLTVTSMNELVKEADEANRVMTLMLGAIAGVSLLVGGLGIMNIMLVSVTERTGEIGLRKALGAKQGDLMYQFLVEAVILTGLGVILGLIVGNGVAELIHRYGIETVVTLRASYVAVTVALSVGVLFGVYPAYLASGMSPVEALRRE